MQQPVTHGNPMQFALPPFFQTVSSVIKHGNMVIIISSKITLYKLLYNHCEVHAKLRKLHARSF